ncbi:serine protease [Pontibacillus halophilus JSM 076056 = DSM 19796]|uniref:Serine protease n=1 Tax=Pontibacillus halophilus JSM 076056 = DSM 19796 TaxID=1385510 RepID=A0A0A5I6X7_9BACI|nr:patatin family protein [Pontibacillus halophilus]KGX91582.1 serine protease [Pontibacillus halophilus JSM 076056 = DSM 19796]
MTETGLVLEGGGMRGAYTAGVLDLFLDEGIQFPYCIGASAGACNGSSYAANQRGRNYDVMVGYGAHPEYISYKRAFTKRELFGMDFIFDTLPNKLVPFDYDGFQHYDGTFVVATTDIKTGEPVYYDTYQDRAHLLKLVRASSSLPLIADSISDGGRLLMDGGIADPIPIQPSIDAGNQKHVVVLTRNPGYKKEPMKFSWLIKRKYKQYPALLHALATRHKRYNETIERLEQLEAEGKLFIIQPQQPLKVSRIERNTAKLHALYEQGYEEAKHQQEALKQFLSSTPAQFA